MGSVNDFDQGFEFFFANHSEGNWHSMEVDLDTLHQVEDVEDDWKKRTYIEADWGDDPREIEVPFFGLKSFFGAIPAKWKKGQKAFIQFKYVTFEKGEQTLNKLAFKEGD